jgi:hypothetical protein
MGLPGYGVRTAKRCEALPGRLLPAKSPVRLTGDRALDCGGGSTVVVRAHESREISAQTGYGS